MSLQRLYDLDKSSARFSDQLDELLRDKEYLGGLRGLPELELVQLVNHLNDILIHLDHSGGSSRKCLQVLRKICGFGKVLPTAYNLSGDVSPIRQLPDAFGGFCDVYEGTLNLNVRVCIKRVRISVNGDRGKVKEMFCKEAVVWKRLNHPNIVPFRGVTFDPLQLVSEWMSGGELRKYVKKNRDRNLINFSLGIAEGLAYLHSREVIHGDLSGSNIMVDGSGNARIMDFGLATIARDSNSLTSTTNDQTHAFRWTAPEISGSGGVASKASDVFSFGMVITEVFTGEVPFNRVKASEVVMLIIRGKRPERPNHPKFTSPFWTLTQMCWVDGAQDRPKMEDVARMLEELQATDTLTTPSGDPGTVTASPPIATSQGLGTEGGGILPPSSLADAPELGLESPPKGKGGGNSLHRLIGVTGPSPASEHTTATMGQPKKHGLWCRARAILLLYVRTAR